MRFKLIFPKWRKLEHQTEFHLPPHGAVVFAAEIPCDVDLSFVDDNLETINFDEPVDMVGISVLLTCQLSRAFEIADRYRAKGVAVIFGGISATLHAEEVATHADAVFLGEVEGRFQQVLDDFKKGSLQKKYDYLRNPPDIKRVNTARRDILNREIYNYRGVQMFDLVHASRGCKFNCFPCSSAFLGGRSFRPRPVKKVIEEMEAIPNNRLFIVDNSLAQNRKWLIELFQAMIPLKKKWVSHPILYDHKVLKLAAKAGCWYVYQAVIDTSDVIHNRIQMLKDHGIGVQGTILLGTDDQDETAIKQLVDFLLKVDLDMAEFTILTPYLFTPIRARLEHQRRITSNNWADYTCDRVVFQPKHMSAEKLQSLYHYAWRIFYADMGFQLRMGKLFMQVMQREIEDGTLHRYDHLQQRRFGRKSVIT